MSIELYKAPTRLRKTLYRSDHFWVDSKNAATLPRYKSTAFSSTAEQLLYSNQEACLGICLNGYDPSIDVDTRSNTNCITVNGTDYGVNPSTTSNLIVTCAASDSYALTADVPIWYSNMEQLNGGVYTCLKTRWSTTHVPVDGKYQTCEMREPVGLNSHMLYYNKMNVLRKKFRITFTPMETRRPTANTSGTPANGFKARGNSTNDNFDAPITYPSALRRGDVLYTPPNNKYIACVFEDTTAQYPQTMPFWKVTKSPIPIKKSRDGMKIGVFGAKLGQPVVFEYVISALSTYGKKFDLGEDFWYLSGNQWTNDDQHKRFVNFLLYTQDTSDSAYTLPCIEGKVRIESWTDCLFFDRKELSVVAPPTDLADSETAVDVNAAETALELEPAD